MVMTDPIADMLTRIRNANQMKHKTVDIPASKLKAEILSLLKAEGYITDYTLVASGIQGVLRVTLKYLLNEERAVRGLKKISKPGLRVYAKTDDLPRVLNGLGIAIVSTSQGIMTDREARKRQVGGEVLAYIW
ncbi:MAG: 30S ribosomal protein S8 [Candidatus Izemoplasmatales bacterium]|jgi:small subunit ribosomal protein S8|nr:30S ribosomal protein S8 [Candidatus Izemoplasmatales bacterium]MDD4354576.1 30S ribosomal protein S8 [Candidatus Izemoplasmatales bacterium]MDD4988032.1 30S ribosomal protein S8 [Candidatus Izemoplasmatales bacterium]MDY0372789.1 30S ribosomal protein S8 [Candidatus Izemoplasmatales bacterium]NLF48962.1 30S ribosomal protein S8 [Acholeplasmataceae bacterium]